MRLLQCMSLLLARTGHGAMSALSLLSGVKRKSGLRAVRSVVDPKPTFRVCASWLVERLCL